MGIHSTRRYGACHRVQRERHPTCNIYNRHGLAHYQNGKYQLRLDRYTKKILLCYLGSIRFFLEQGFVSRLQDPPCFFKRIWLDNSSQCTPSRGSTPTRGLYFFPSLSHVVTVSLGTISCFPTLHQRTLT